MCKTDDINKRVQGRKEKENTHISRMSEYRLDIIVWDRLLIGEEV